MRFADRGQSGRLLAELLRASGVEPDVVLGVARGGAVVAREVAADLGAELGVIAVRKIAAPWNPEFAVGAVAAGVPAWIDHARARELGIGADHLAAESDRKQRECARMDADFARFGLPNLADRDVLIVDDALATGASAIAAARRARFLRAGTVAVAAPVASASAAALLYKEKIALHCLAVEPDLPWSGSCFDEFPPVSEEEVCRILSRHRDANPVGVRPLAIAREGAALSALLELPHGSGPFPAVVLVHGREESKESAPIRQLATRLREAGFATLSFDLSGCGSSSPSSEPQAIRFVRDLAAVFAWALSAPELDRRRIAICGVGFGAWIALRAADDGEVGAAALVLCAPPLQRPDLAALDVPCLLVVGSEDANVSGVVAAASACRSATLEIIPGADHPFAAKGALDAAVQLVTRWLSSELAPRGFAGAGARDLHHRTGDTP